MINKLALTVALLLAAATAVSAQDTTPPANGRGDAPTAGGTAQEVAPHGPVTDCPHSDSSCVWGQLLNATGRAGTRGRPSGLPEGPVDVCHIWDYNCSAPVQTVCELHGPHGWPGGRHDEEEGSFFFVLRTNQAWRIKPRVAGSHRTWRPTEYTVPRGVAAGSANRVDFSLLSAYSDTSICD